MPRRSPSEIRTQLPRRRTHHRRAPVIRGLSVAENRQIAVFERRQGLSAGEVAYAYRRWNADIRPPREDLDRFYERDDTDLRTGDHHVRTLLEIRLHALRSKARCELSTVITPADERVLERTLNDPFAPPDHRMSRIDVCPPAVPSSDRHPKARQARTAASTGQHSFLVFIYAASHATASAGVGGWSATLVGLGQGWARQGFGRLLPGASVAAVQGVTDPVGAVDSGALAGRSRVRADAVVLTGHQPSRSASAPHRRRGSPSSRAARAVRPGCPGLASPSGVGARAGWAVRHRAIWTARAQRGGPSRRWPTLSAGPGSRWKAALSVLHPVA